MSDRFYTRSKVPTASSDGFVPMNLVQKRPFVVQAKPAPTSDAQQAQRLDAKLLQNLGVQTKLTVGAPGDQYEQEADRVASDVVAQINSPQAQRPVQREAMPEEEDELQMKPMAHTLQREAMPEEEDELQMKPMVQRNTVDSGDASAGLESAINSARGGGQSLDEDLQRSMGQAMGTDFSGVRVHTDTQADQLNQSIQARAFTTGQDVFFRQGAYQPESRGGQELIAHELTHVIQQNGRK